MINYFYSYVKTIIVFIIFMSFMQVIIPNSKYKSYINLIFGILLVFVMVDPVKNIYFNIKNGVKVNVFDNYTFQDYAINTSEYEEKQNKMVMDLFKGNMKTQISNLLDNKYSIDELEIDLNDDDYSSVQISRIYLKLSPSKNDTNVEKFHQNSIPNSAEVLKIKSTLSEFYSVSQDNIILG